MKLKAIEKICGLIYPYKIGEQLVETLGAVYNAAGVAAEQEQMRV